MNTYEIEEFFGTTSEQAEYLVGKVDQLNKAVEFSMGFGLTKDAAIDVLIAEKQKLLIASNGMSQYGAKWMELAEWMAAHDVVIGTYRRLKESV